ncbi:hypothetical protein D4R99_03140 [bacterium]|nr:MAG: hypothetical protein D4R99_03140 [bacterium]
MKLAISTILAALVLFILGFLFYWGAFATGHLQSYLHIMRGAEDQKMWANIVGFLLQGFFLSFLYQYYFKGLSPFKEGLTYGLIIGLLMSVPVVFFMWANYTVSYKAVLLEGAGMGFRILVAGIVIGLVYGRKETK